MRVAVTFCNQHSTPRLSVCAVDLDNGERAWLGVPAGFDRGAAGMTAIDGDLLVACQPGGVFRYGRELEPAKLIPTPNARNLHSILYRAGEHALYVTSASNDTLFRYGLDPSGTTVVETDEIYCADPQRRGQDRYHLNSVAEWNGELFVTMFGATDGRTHRDRRNGRVARVSDGHTLVDGLYHPHSVIGIGADLFVVESQARTVRRIAGGTSASWQISGGYPRGIIGTAPGRVWVGVSALRRESSSLGTQNVIDSTSPLDFRTRLVELDLESGTVGRTIDLTDLGAEIFEIRVLPDGADFVPSADGGRSQRIEALEAGYRALRLENRSFAHSRATPRQRLARMARRFR